MLNKFHNNHMQCLGFSHSVARFVLSLGQTQDLTDCRLSAADISLDGGKYCIYEFTSLVYSLSSCTTTCTSRVSFAVCMYLIFFTDDIKMW